MNLATNFADVFGDVHLADAVNSVITVSSAAVATFYDDVDHDGNAIDVAPGSRAVFFADVTGAGDFTGDGDVFFEGTYSPGSSPAAVGFQGDVTFGADALLLIELGGVMPGDEYDQLNIDGDLFAGGDLIVTLLGDYDPLLDDQFNIINYGSLAGGFNIGLPSLAPQLSWLTDIGSTGLTLSVIPEPGTLPLLAIVALTLLRRRSKRVV